MHTPSKHPDPKRRTRIPYPRVAATTAVVAVTAATLLSTQQNSAPVPQQVTSESAPQPTQLTAEQQQMLSTMAADRAALESDVLEITRAELTNHGLSTADLPDLSLRFEESVLQQVLPLDVLAVLPPPFSGVKAAANPALVSVGQSSQKPPARTAAQRRAAARKAQAAKKAARAKARAARQKAARAQAAKRRAAQAAKTKKTQQSERSQRSTRAERTKAAKAKAAKARAAKLRAAKQKAAKARAAKLRAAKQKAAKARAAKLRAAKAKASKAKAAKTTAKKNPKKLRRGGKNWKFHKPVRGRRTSPYGMRMHPIYKYLRMHTGTDFGGGCGAKILAAESGTIVRGRPRGGYGNQLMINHGVINGKVYVTTYSHLSGYAVKRGQKVRRGQHVAYEGTTGASTGCHLHFEVFENGRRVNPEKYLRNGGR